MGGVCTADTVIVAVVVSDRWALAWANEVRPPAG